MIGRDFTGKRNAFHAVNNLSQNEIKNVVLIPTNDDEIPSYGEWNRLFRKSRILMIPPSYKRAWEFLTGIRDKGLLPLNIVIEDSHVKHVFTGNLDLAEELEELTNKRSELVLTEMAFSTNGGITEKDLDWSKNSQLNEGAIGIHFGIGDGLTGAHIDFICPGVKLTN
ncbi:hypothetical protein EV207_13928 [Scopulibacillus darangshiensis]|uniref:Crocagin biosynthetic protein CgnE/B domain-containing protein n=1 Tax=Scopulibacillus darangshiensis TaxID=442528 RepID=A0A4V2SL40_9BACL|nr:hypothetical protein [Scopulibacillus darangshiensis]TCP21886.1 hypothetical protein EV207_13928 [Scopulibacillus darangshiensis]